MALKWCWAFGLEDSTLLNDMGWALPGATTSYVPSNTFTYTYAGSPARTSMRVNYGDDMNLPPASFSPQGWVTFAVYNDQPLFRSTSYPVRVIGGGNNRQIYIVMTNGSSSTFALYVDNTFKETFTLASQNWHYFALQYDMSTNTWSGRAYVNGVAVTAAYTDASTAQTDGAIVLEAFSNNNSFPTEGTTYWAQIAVYDSVADTPESPRFVTRINPDTDSSEVGTWTPSAGATNVGVTANDPFDPATYTEEPTPSSGDNVITTFASDIATLVGVNPTTIDGVTAHAYASGTAIDAFAASGSGGAFVNGSNFTPDLADTTYGYATAPLNPNTVAAWVGTDIVQTKFEIV